MFLFPDLSNIFLQEHLQVIATKLLTKTALPPPSFRDLRKLIKHT